MYLTQEMYNLILCPHQVTSFTGQSRTPRKPEMLRYSNKYVDSVLSFKASMFKSVHICIKLQNLTVFIRSFMFFRKTDKILGLLSHTILQTIYKC